MKKFITYLLSIAAALGVGVLAGLLTRGSIEIYSSAVKPPLSPPAVVFPIVWIILYILMGVGLGLVLTSPRATDDALIFYGPFGFSFSVCLASHLCGFYCFLW